MSQFEPDLDVVARRLQGEAKNLARALGHTWAGSILMVPGKHWRAWCPACGANCSIEPRAWNKAPLRGEMVILRCRPTREGSAVAALGAI